ncbi:MAG: hypothetical protein SFW09_07405 [Hyphomicrobiaceae bacterium]|nr:hypothetical protein [Hyphomicrobiaceae bacterium]
MASLGYAIALLICPAGDASCHIIGLRVTRYADVASCEAALPAARAILGRRPENVGVLADCRALDELCRPSVSWAPAVAQSRLGLLSRVGGAQPSGLSIALDILCRPPGDDPCIGLPA